jgi:hypothetical protein
MKKIVESKTTEGETMLIDRGAMHVPTCYKCGKQGHKMTKCPFRIKIMEKGMKQGVHAT